MRTEKLVIPLLFLCLILVACEEPEVGNTFVLKKPVLGGSNIDSMKNVMNDMEIFEEIDDPDAVEEYVDLSDITNFSVNTIVRVTDMNDKKSMIQIQKIYPKTGSYPKIWIDKEELKTAHH